MQVWTQQAHYEPTSNFNIGTKLEFKILYKWNIFFSIWNCSSSSSTLCNTKARKTPPKKEKERESRNLYSITEK
jgi:hypothetical protein